MDSIDSVTWRRHCNFRNMVEEELYSWKRRTLIVHGTLCRDFVAAFHQQNEEHFLIRLLGTLHLAANGIRGTNNQDRIQQERKVLIRVLFTEPRTFTKEQWLCFWSDVTFLGMDRLHIQRLKDISLV